MVRPPNRPDFGDNVLFRCGDTWRGEVLVITHSGSDAAPLSFGSYPAACEDKPVISGSKLISGWISFQTNIYYADLGTGDNAGQFPLGINQLFDATGRLPLGRWPNIADHGDGGYSTIDSHPGSATITDSDLPAGDWSGAVVHIKGMRWYMINREVVSSSSQTLVLNADGSCWSGSCTGWGYFINSHLQTLDQEGEWYFDSASNRVYLYTETGQPPDNSLEGSVILADDTRAWRSVTI